MFSLPFPQPLFIALWLTLLLFLTFSNEKWGAFFVVLSLPCYLIRFKIFGLPTTCLEIMIYLFFTASILKLKHKHLLKKRFSQLIQKLKSEPLLIAGLLFIIGGAGISTIYSAELKASIGIFKGWFFDPLLFFISILLISKRESELPALLFRAFFYSGIGVGIIALGYAGLGKFTYDYRLKAFFLSPNHLGMYLAYAFFGYLSLKRTFFRQISVLLFILLPLFLTYSLGTWSGILGALAVLFLFKNQKKRKRILAYCLGFVAFTGLLVLFTLKSDFSLKRIITNKFASFHSRLVIWRSAFKIGIDHWFAGIGPGSFQKVYLEYQKYFTPYPEWAVPQPHNIFLAFWLQTGLLGLSGFITTIYWFYKKSYIFLQKANKNKKPALAGLTAISYTLFHGLIDTPYWKNDLCLIFWLAVMSILLVSHSRSKGSE